MIKLANIKSGLLLRSLPIGGVALMLLLVWLCRAGPQYPEIGDGVMFCVRQTPEQDGMADITIHKLTDADRSAMNTDTANAADLYTGEGSLFSSKKQSNFLAPAPRTAGPASQNRNGLGDSSSGLFGSDQMDSFSKINLEPDTRSWGWLADDVKSSESPVISDDYSRRSSRRLLSDDDSLGNGFRSGRSSEDSLFYRQDRRW